MEKNVPKLKALTDLAKVELTTIRQLRKEEKSGAPRHSHSAFVSAGDETGFGLVTNYMLNRFADGVGAVVGLLRGERKHGSIQG